MIKKMAICILISCIICLVGCGKNKNFFYSYEKAYDDNEKLSSNRSSYSYLYKEGTNNEEKANINFSFSGYDILWKFDVEKDIELECSNITEIDEGEFKIIIVSPSGEVQVLTEGTNTNVIVIPLQEGENILKIVGKKAVGKSELELSNTEGVKVIPIAYSKEE